MGTRLFNGFIKRSQVQRLFGTDFKGDDIAYVLMACQHGPHDRMQLATHLLRIPVQTFNFDSHGEGIHFFSSFRWGILKALAINPSVNFESLRRDTWGLCIFTQTRFQKWHLECVMHSPFTGGTVVDNQRRQKKQSYM